MNSNDGNGDISKFGYLGIFTELEKLAKKQPNYIHLSQCDPPVYGYVLEESILDQIDQLQISQYTKYPSWNGDEDLREALNQRIKKVCGVDLPSNRIILTYGVSECFPLTFDALFHQTTGSVAIPDPSYIPLTIQSRRFSNVWFYPCEETDQWNPNIDLLTHALESRPDTKALVIITPNSPCGAVYPEKVLKELINIAGQYNLTIITDEIYDSLSFERFNSPLKFTKEVPVIYMNGFSKVYRLPGYRIGYLGWYDPLDKFPEIWNHLVHLCKGRLGITPLAQEIAKIALQEPEENLQRYVKSVYEKQNVITKHLKAIDGVTVVPAKGGTYVFPNIRLEINDEEIVKHLLKFHGIFVTPGSAYGPTVAPGHLRFVTLASKEELLKGVHALEDTIKTLR